jgi:ribosomal protein S18 acetylase RimI-like enzyme
MVFRNAVHSTIAQDVVHTDLPHLASLASRTSIHFLQQYLDLLPFATFQVSILFLPFWRQSSHDSITKLIRCQILVHNMLVYGWILLLALAQKCTLSPNLQEQVPISTVLTIRNATISDAKAITNIVSSAFHDSPHWKYVYQFMENFPEEHFNCMYREALQVIPHPDIITQVVILPNNTYPYEMIPVASAIWVLPTAFNKSSGETHFIPSLFNPLSRTKCKHRDLNLTRAEDYRAQSDAAEEEYLNSVYARRNQLYLHSLATHPDYQRRGAAGALLTSGLQIGKDAYSTKNVTATLIATEAGEPVYL